MNLTEEERNTLKKFYKQVQFNDDDFVYYVLFSFILSHYPHCDVFELDETLELDNLKDALIDVFHLVKPFTLKKI
jgi:hypothetical protein